jgi:CHAT domain-containing protein
MSGLGRLFTLLRIQSQATPLLLEAHRLKDVGDLAGARAASDRLIESLRAQLAGTLEFNRELPTGVPLDLAAVLNQLLDALLVEADVVEALGDRPAAERLRQEAVALAKEHLPGSGVAERERQRAGALLGEGRFNEALVALAGARDLFSVESHTLDAALTAANLANVLEWLGDHERALAEADRAARLAHDRLARGRPKSQDIWSALFTGRFQDAQELARLQQVALELDQVHARIARYTGRFEEAEQRFAKVYPDIPDVAKPAIDFQYAAIRVGQGRYQEALALIGRLAPLFGGLLRPKLAVLLRVKAEALLGLDEMKAALEAAEQALADTRKFFDPELVWKTHWLRGKILVRLDRHPEALDAYRQAVDTVSGLRRAPLGWRLDSTFLGDKQPLFRDGIRLAATLGDAEAASRLIEMVKSRTLTATLSVPRVSPPTAAENDATEQMSARVDELSRQLDALDYGSYAESWTPERIQHRRVLLDDRAALLERLRIADPRWRAVTAPVPFDLPKLQRLLASRDQAVLTFFAEPERITAVLLRGDDMRVAIREVPAEVARALEAFVTNFSKTTPTMKLFDPVTGLGLTVDQLAPADLVRAAIGARSLVVVPHGHLHLLPWAGLTFESRRLFEYLPVGILPNLTCLTALAGAFTARPRVALLGAPEYPAGAGLVPLAGAAEELRVVAETYAASGGLIDEPRSGKAATESAFRALAQAPGARGGVLHLACHARFEDDEPMFSVLQLADAQLDAAEIARARLPFDEAVLSGCWTGERAMAVQGIALLGDDILGLPGAFLEAGVRSVLVSIPPASDSATLRFMTLYHEQRADGSPPLVALQATQKALLKDGLYPPHLWVGFTIYGAQ